jgi:uncharacterized protein YbjT (DUF2867 family)
MIQMRDTHADRIAIVFGGTGFVGRRIVKHLYDHDFLVRIASRHLDRARIRFGEDEPRLQTIMADIHDDASVAAAVADGYGVVNAVSLYVERGTETFQSVHVAAAARIARYARYSAVRRLVHVSGIGAAAAANSPYICSRGRGEAAVKAEFPDAIIVRSAAMFGPDDAFLTLFCEFFVDFQHIRCLAAAAHDCSRFTLRT